VALGFGITAAIATRKPPESELDKLWLTDMEQAIETATAQDKPILLYVSATWCSSCKQMQRSTFRDRDVIERAQEYVLLKVDVDEDPATARKFEVRFLPTMVVLTSDGAKLTTDRGYMDPVDFLDLLDDGRERFDRLDGLGDI
jgi:thiol:disulfide interchange protein